MSRVSNYTLLRDGIAAAKAGNKALTRQLLQQLTEIDPGNEQAWLWLAGVAETPQDALMCLRRVLEINPGNDRARQGMKEVRLQAAAAEVRSGHPAKALPLLLEVTELEPDNEEAWLLMAQVAESPQGRLACLQRVLDINPGNDQARAALRNARIQAAFAEAKAGSTETARAKLKEIVEIDPRNVQALAWLAELADSPEDALAYWQRVLDINPQHEQAREGVRLCQAEIEAHRPAWQCPLCLAGDEAPQARCRHCGAYLTLEDVHSLLLNPEVRPEPMHAAIERYENVLQRKTDFDTYFYLGLAYLNLKDVDAAVPPLQAACRLRPDDTKLRARVEDLARLKVAVEDAIEGSDRRSASRRPCVLVIDDSPTICKLVAMTLERHGYRVVAAANGLEAADTILRGMPQLILLDILLPGSDGFEICRHIRANRETADIPIVMLTCLDGFADRMRARLLGANAYITKPFNPEDLVQTVRSLCSPTEG
ncbi:MAG: response regulator [Gemmataceae bacterium]|nr:response regulator [Gemmataceae bacterium]MDW8265723.1 response regulator [Gemmataceae bacterium]